MWWKLRDPVVRRLDPAYSGSDRSAPGAGAGYRARLHHPHLSPAPTGLYSHSATGGRGAGPAASGGERCQPDCRAPGGGSAALPHHPMVPGHGTWAAPQPGGHRGRHAIHQLYCQAKAFTHPAEQQRRAAQLVLERRLLALCRPFLDDPSAAQAKLCRRMENHIKELFVFVAHPEVPPDNNAAERSLPSAGKC